MQLHITVLLEGSGRHNSSSAFCSDAWDHAIVQNDVTGRFEEENNKKQCKSAVNERASQSTGTTAVDRECNGDRTARDCSDCEKDLCKCVSERQHY